MLLLLLALWERIPLGAFILVVPMVGATVAAALLIRPDVRPWFAKRD